MSKFLGLILVFVALSTEAAISTVCEHDRDGAIHCNASESGSNVMGLSCAPGNSGSTSCSGNYVDNGQQNLKMECRADTSGGTNCSGKSSDGTAFAMLCSKAGGRLKCSIGDNRGQQITMDCILGKDGIPVCNALDNAGGRYDVTCSGAKGNLIGCQTN